jgi:hypothetical protein
MREKEKCLMRIKPFIWMFVVAMILFALACAGKPPGPVVQTQPPKDQPPTEPVALPNNGFKAEITLVEPPAKLRSGQKETVRVKVKNTSDVMWWSRGAPVNPRSDNKFYLAAGNRWLKADGTLQTNMDGRYGIGKDLKPGEDTEVPLVITAPKDPGEYTLEVDLIQEQVAWFSDKGSPTAKAKITVVK